MEEHIHNILSCYTGKSIELIPILQQIQNEFGYLPEPAMKKAAKYVGVPESRVYGVATFYEQFRFKPMGRDKVTVCRGTACHVLGAQRIMEEIERQLGIKEGETTDDFNYTLQTAACIGCCGLAPTIVINETTYGHLTPATVIKIINEREAEKNGRE